MDQQIFDLYDRFTHGYINRRDFLDRLSVVVGSSAAATATLSLLQNDYAKAETVPANDPRLISETVSYDGPGGKMSGYLVRLKDKGKRPAVLVIHENRGLNPHIEDIARRLALAGYLALAVDLLSPMGGTPKDQDQGRDMIAKLNLDETEKNAAAGVTFLKKHPESTGKVGAVGFCWGGAMMNRLAATSPDLDAAVVYYGRPVPADRVAAIKAPLLLHYAENDNSVNPGVPAYEEALKANHKVYEKFTYPGTQHAFNNDTGNRYNKEQATIAWDRTLAFFKKYLS
ncbi:MAG TPA: dienelactone hydrolase family protein [Xanthobacteraceae bacterium]|nr:dienelactone hydrolase family protein [Xanthobacteraceae bacterium]